MQMKHILIALQVYKCCATITEREGRKRSNIPGINKVAVFMLGEDLYDAKYGDWELNHPVVFHAVKETFEMLQTLRDNNFIIDPTKSLTNDQLSLYYSMIDYFNNRISAFPT